MLRFLARFTGFWLLAAALVAVVIDGAKSIAASDLVATPLGIAWSQLAPSSFDQLRLAIEEQFGQAWLWDLLSGWILSAPVWLIFGLLGLILMLLGRRRRRGSIGEEGYI
jgi:hypothetical protein